MADIGTRASKGNWVREITGYQWLVLFVAWAGGSLDITDFTLYGLVLRQAPTELIGGTPAIAEIGKVGPERFAAVRARRRALATRHDHREEDREFLRIVPLQLFSRGIRFQTLV